MDAKVLQVLRGLTKILIDDSTNFTRGAITAQMLVVRCLLQSGAVDKGLLSSEVAKAVAALTNDQQKTSYPRALIELARVVDVETTARYQSPEEAMLQALEETDPKKWH